MRGAMKARCHVRKAAALLLAAVLLAANPAVANEFLSSIEDLPLMSGLSEAEGGVMAFDSPAGRIVEALTQGPVRRQDVSRFYSETLPQLGWQETAPGRFVRENEMLRLEFPVSSATADLSVRFMLSPLK